MEITDEENCGSDDCISSQPLSASVGERKNALTKPLYKITVQKCTLELFRRPKCGSHEVAHALCGH
jgi:hypothetical protein